jgi:branched-chain amino acid transport system permease protein
VDTFLILIIGLAYAMASLFLISVGLAIVFGMMRIINFAHGEFIMLGGFTFITAVHAGVNVWVAMLVIAPLAVGILGVLVERLVIRRLYGNLVQTILATWGLGLLLAGFATIVFGYSRPGVAPPIDDIHIGNFSQSGYTLFIIGIAIGTAAGLYALFRFTDFGLKARATMQNPAMAAAVGLNVSRLYSLTFGLGSALAGLAGALIAPISGVLPSMGASYIAKTFITVISGGPLALTGTFVASGVLGIVNETASFLTTPVIGEAALLTVAIVTLRVLPTGITGRFFRSSI